MRWNAPMDTHFLGLLGASNWFSDISPRTRPGADLQYPHLGRQHRNPLAVFLLHSMDDAGTNAVCKGSVLTFAESA